MATIKIGDILKVKPSNALVQVFDIEKSMVNLVLLKNYWKQKYNMKLPQVFDTIVVVFPTHNKKYNYPRYRKCIKKPIFQKRAKRFFKIQRHFALEEELK